MTQPKHGRRRLGFPDETDDPALVGVGRSHEDIRQFAQWVFLQVVAREVPDVLRTLRRVPRAKQFQTIDLELDDVWDIPSLMPSPDPALLERWAERWHLTADWCLAHAIATWRVWRRYPKARLKNWADRDDLAGSLQPRGRPPTVPRPLKKIEHFMWLIESHVGNPSYYWLAERDFTSEQTVSEACIRLARLIELPLRRQRGRPRAAR